MKIAVVGTGAMGSIYAGLLADGGNEVWAIDVWREHLEAIAQNGLRIEGASGDRVVKGLRTSAEVGDAGPCDLYIIATKASGVGAAAQAISACMGPDSLVLTIQNGLGAGERIAQHMDTGNVLLGVAGGFSASMVGPGHAHHNGMELIRVGEMNGGMTDRLQRVVKVWTDAGFSARAFEDINQLVWEKFICNVTFSAPCTVFGCTIGEVMDNPERWAVALGCTMEAYRMGRAKDIRLSFDDPIDYVTKFGQSIRNGRPSMLLDHMAGRPSEIDAINGQVPVLGKELGIDAPYNQALSAVVRAREEGFETARK